MTSSEHKTVVPMRVVEKTTPSRSRRPKTLYSDMVEQFLEMGVQTVEIDLDAIGIKPPTLRAGLAKAIAEMQAEDVVEFSIRPSVGLFYLMRQDIEEK